VKFRSVGNLVLTASLVLMNLSGAAVETNGQVQVRSGGIERAVRHELVMLPYYGVFDWLEFSVGSDNSVKLFGQVVRPSTKSDAERRVRKLAGVRRVVNQIEILPTSAQDDQLRRSVYQAIYGSNSPLFHYANGTDPSLHIIVNRGRVTLKGVVANQGDATQAYIRARTVPGSFAVNNELTVESELPS
jgi:hyperosmotically inducible protein